MNFELQEWVRKLPEGEREVLRLNAAADGLVRLSAALHALVFESVETTEDGENELFGMLGGVTVEELRTVLGAMEVIGFKHPDKEVRGLFQYRYRTMAERLGLFPEDEREMEDRLKPGSNLTFLLPASPEKGNVCRE